jgi:hypothetical protein
MGMLDSLQVRFGQTLEVADRRWQIRCRCALKNEVPWQSGEPNVGYLAGLARKRTGRKPPKAVIGPAGLD